jgi:hypothetical protein
MPKTKKFKKLLKQTQKHYGKNNGKQIAFAIAKKRNWRI